MIDKSGRNDRYPNVGDLTPNFTLDSVYGNKISLNDYAGKQIVIYMWASW